MATTIVWSDAARRRAIEASTSEDDGDGRRACGWLVGASRCAESAHRSLIRLGDEVMTEETVGRFGVEVEEIRGMLPGGMRVIGAFVEVDLDAEARLEARAFYSALSRGEAMSVVGGNAGPFYVATVRGDDIEVFECGETTKRVEIVSADDLAHTRRAFRCALSISFDARGFDDVRRELAEDVVFTARRGDVVAMLTSGRKVNQIVDEDSPVTNVCVRVRGSKHAVSDVSEAPVVRCDPRELFLVNSRKSVAHLDVVAFVEESDDVKNLIALLTSLLIEQTSRMEDVIRASKENIVEPRAFHFSPPGLGHWITVIYPFTRGLIADEASLASERHRKTSSSRGHFISPLRISDTGSPLFILSLAVWVSTRLPSHPSVAVCTSDSVLHWIDRCFASATRSIMRAVSARRRRLMGACETFTKWVCHRLTCGAVARTS